MIPVYKTISKIITVKDIANLIYIKCKPETTLLELIELYKNYNLYYFEYCLIQDKGKVFGCLTLEDIMDIMEYDQEIGDYIRIITPDMIISDSTPAIRMPSLFQRSDVFFVMVDDNMSSFVTYHDLEKLPMRLAIITRILELEEGIIDYLLQYPDSDEIKDAFNRINPQRINAIKRICKASYGENRSLAPQKLLTYTNFNEKKEIIKCFPKLMNHFPFETSSDFDAFFVTLKKIRDRTAHSDQILPVFMSQERFSTFLIDLGQTIDAVTELAENRK